MGWRTVLWQLLALLTTLIVTRGGEFEDQSDRMWTEPFEPTAGVPFDVFCSHKGYNIEQTRLQIATYDNTRYLINDTIFNDRVDNTTVKHSVKGNPPGKFELLEFFCLSQGKVIWHLKRWVAPEPDVSDFECRWEEDSDAIECSFSQLGEEMYWNYISYFLVINDSDGRVECEPSPQNKSRIQCNCNGFSSSYLIEDNSFNFKLFVKFDKREQIKEFNLTREQIEVPTWTFRAAEIFWRDQLACLNIDYDDPDPEPSKYQWRILLQPLNPSQEQWEAKVQIEQLWSRDICFDYPSYGDQHYELRLWRRFDKPDTPWTSLSRVFLFSSLATVPNRPPQLLPNGFYHDQGKGELYVYWKPLDELEFGSTGFKYAVSTDSGHEALVLGNHSALIRNWNSTQPATVTIWSENSVGRSVNNSQLDVSILTNTERRQPQDVWYNIDNNTVTWIPPLVKDNLTGYTFYWCLISKNPSGFCDDLESIQFIELSQSEEQFQIDKSIVLYHTAVAAEYRENISGGMIWSRPKPIWKAKTASSSKQVVVNSYLVMTVIIVMVATFGLICLFFYIFRNSKDS